MGIGSTAKKLQKVTEMAEDVYVRMNDLRDQVVEMRETTRETSDRVDRLETESAEMRAILSALAEEEGIDVESVVADAHISEAERAAEEETSTEGTEATGESTSESESTTSEEDAKDAGTGA